MDGTGRGEYEVTHQYECSVGEQPYCICDTPIPPCPCECNSGGFCGGCGHAGCGRR
jgi:hypothetical protein